MKASLRAWRRQLRWRLLLAASSHEVIHDISVLITNRGIHASNEALLAKIRGALDLIAKYQPWRLSRMRRDVDRIWVRRHTLCRAAFWPASRSCVLDTFFVATFAEPQIASSIIHEGIHARLRSRDWSPPPELAGREERLCRQAELWFGRAVPGGKRVVQRIEEMLALSDEELSLNDNQRREADRQALRAELQELALPRWWKRRIARKRGFPEIAAEL